MFEMWVSIPCLECQCNKEGSVEEDCDVDDGTCNCKENIVGIKCDECKESYFGFPQCKSNF